jgi:hypothetical protein
MPWTVEYVADKEMVLVVSRGQIKDEDLKVQLGETIRTLREHSATLALVDYAEAQSAATLPALYYLPDQATRSGAPWHLRVALVLPRSGYRLDTYRFFELVFRSAGYDVRSFDSREAAEDWLLHPPPVKRAINYPAHA